MAHKKNRRNKKRWIQHALSKHKKGALHRQLGIPENERIPIALLREAAKEPNGSKLGARARLALKLHEYQKRKHRKR